MNSKTIRKFYHLVQGISETPYVNYNDVDTIVKFEVNLILEQIEDCKFSQLGELIEKLKEEYK